MRAGIHGRVDRDRGAAAERREGAVPVDRVAGRDSCTCGCGYADLGEADRQNIDKFVTGSVARIRRAVIGERDGVGNAATDLEGSADGVGWGDADRWRKCSACKMYWRDQDRPATERAGAVGSASGCIEHVRHPRGPSSVAVLAVLPREIADRIRRRLAAKMAAHGELYSGRHDLG